MNTLSYSMVSLHVISIALSVVCLIITLKNHRKRAAYALSLILIMAIIGSIATFMEITSSTFDTKHLWRNILQIGLFIMPAAALNFVRLYTEDRSKGLKAFTYFAFIYQIIAVILIFTNDYHHLMRESVELVIRNGSQYLLVKQTIFGKVVGALNTLVSLTAMVRLTIFYKRCSKSSRSQVLIILIGFLIPIVYSYLKLAILQSIGFTIPTATSFLIGNVMILLGYFKYDLMTISPIAKDWAFDEMRDGIVFGGNDGEILDLNITAEVFLGSDKRSLNKVILESYPLWDRAIKEKHDAQIEIKVNKSPVAYYEVTVQPFIKNNHSSGTISILREITHERREKLSLLKQVEQDGLTKVLNRQAFEIKVNEKIMEASRRGAFGTLVVMDIDNFKNINDTYGHVAGDQVIMEVADFIRLSHRDVDLIGRLGGDEFAVFITDCDLEKVTDIVKRQTQKLSIHSFVYNDQMFKVTLSIGGISMPLHGKTFKYFYEQADIRLYKAKDRGRNCMVIEEL